MIVNSSNKTKKVLAIVFAVVGILLVIGGSYALWTYNFTGGQNIIEADSISLELLESNDEVISIEKALPKADKDGITQSEAFSFAVTTKTASVQDIGYSLKIEKISVDSGYTALSDNQIKVYLTDYNGAELLTPTLIDDLSNYVLYSKTNSHNASVTEIQDKYKLRVWIDFEVDASSWTENIKLQYKFKIGVTGKQEQASTSNAVYSRSESTVSPGNTLESISGYTTDYTTLNENFFLKHNIGSDNTVESQEVCYILNGTMYCLKGCSQFESTGALGDASFACTVTNFEENSATLLSSFGEEYCSVNSNDVLCDHSSGIRAHAYDDGFVNVYVDYSHCIVIDGSASCA